ncbi:hypothetical protein Bbelb_067450 [Branchiostoma belcheri]|nr:hypothetical protein Bbelb_067450 [Branchiostoma belcheri]
MARQSGRVAWYGLMETTSLMHCFSTEDSCLNLTRQIGPDDLKTEEECQVAADRCSIEDYCLNQTWSRLFEDPREISDYCLDLTREDWTRSGDLETQEQDDNYIHRCVLRVGCLFWEKPVDLKMQKEMKTAGTVVIVSDPKTGLQLRRKNQTL